MERRTLQTEIVTNILEQLRRFVTPTYIAKKFGVSYQTVYLWGKGRALPNAEHMVELERLLEKYMELDRST